MEADLRRVYIEFASFGNRGLENDRNVSMDSRACQKLAKDCNILRGNLLTPTDVDLIFAKVKTKGERRINFGQFVEMTRLWAQKLKINHADVIIRISGGSPVLNGMVAEPTKFHDEKARYTGVYKHGGPSTKSVYESLELKELLNREPCDVRGVLLPKDYGHAPPYVSAPPKSPKSPYRVSEEKLERQYRILPKLHPDWFEVEDLDPVSESHSCFYFNPKTNETQWEMPILKPDEKITVPHPPPLPPRSSPLRKASFASMDSGFRVDGYSWER